MALAPMQVQTCPNNQQQQSPKATHAQQHSITHSGRAQICIDKLVVPRVMLAVLKAMTETDAIAHRQTYTDKQASRPTMQH